MALDVTGTLIQILFIDTSSYFVQWSLLHTRAQCLVRVMALDVQQQQDTDELVKRREWCSATNYYS